MTRYSIILILIGITSTLGYSDNISYIDNGTIKVGVNLDLGGAITYVAPIEKPDNIINSHDWGRQIQMSFYSGPIPYEPNGAKPAEVWAGLGWNPIQSGDCAGKRSRMLEHTNDGRSIHVKCIPMQWPLNNVPGDCTFETWITLEDNSAHVKSRLNNNRSDKTFYTARDQELPAIYTNGPWHRLYSYTGDKPFTNGSLSRFTKTWTSFEDAEGSPWTSWTATENWAALVNDANEGLGIHETGVYRFIGGFFGKPGRGGPQDAPTGYISPVHTEILDHNIVYDYEYTLIVGSLDNIRQWVNDHAPRKSLPDYRFGSDRQHWTYRNATDTGWPIKGCLDIKLESGDPQLIGPTAFWQASDVPTLYIDAACKTGHTQARLFWKTHTEPQFTTERSLTFELIPDGKDHLYEIDLTASDLYKGTITGLRFDPAPAGAPGDYIRIKSISHKK